MSQRPRLATALRVAALVCIALATAAPVARIPLPSRTVVYVVDRSDSIADPDLLRAQQYVTAAFQRRGDARVGLVAFSSRPELLLAPAEWAAPPFIIRDRSAAAGTDLAAAIDLAVASLPPGGERRVVIVTDARPTRGDAAAAVGRARRRGVEVDAVPLGFEQPGGFAVAHFAPVRDHAAEGEPIELIAGVVGPAGGSAFVTCERDGQTIAAQAASFDAAGHAEVVFVDTAPPTGPHVYAAHLRTHGVFASADDDRAETIAIVAGRPRVLVLDSAGRCPPLLCNAIAQAGAEARVESLENVDPDEALLQSYDLVVLSDLPVARTGEITLVPGLSPRAQEALATFAQRGGGVVATGGWYGFAPEWIGTPLARMMPVEVKDEGELEDPPVAMAIMLDRSGSMAAMAGEHTKLALAIEAALAAASSLHSDDEVAIASVDTQTNWDLPLAPASELPLRVRRIRAITAGGGGIYVATALVDAYAVLRNAARPIRHVVLFSDTADSEEKFLGCEMSTVCPGRPSAITLARAARLTGITTSVVGIGEDSDEDTRFLRDLAAAGGGRFYVTSRATDLRRIFLAETRAATRSNVREHPVVLQAVAEHPALGGIDVAAMPPLSGYVSTGRRATADTVLATPEGEPILATWRYGLGQVAVLATDAGGEWTGAWASWPGAGQLLRQVVRFASRRQAESTADARVSLGDGAISIAIDAEEGLAARSPAWVELTTLGGSGPSKTARLPALRVAPGRTQASSPTAGEPFAVVRVRDAEGRLLAESIAGRAPVRERGGAGPDSRALGELARAGGGLFAPDAATTLRAGGPRGWTPVAVWPWLLLLAALLVAADVWARRLQRSGLRAQS